MKKIIKRIRQIRTWFLVVIVFFSLFASWWVLRTPVNDFINSLLPNYVCTVSVLEKHNAESVPNYEVWIEDLCLEDTLGVFANNDKILNNIGFEFRKAEDYGYSGDVLTNVKANEGEITFQWKGGNEDYIKFWKQGYSGVIVVEISYDGDVISSEEIDLYSNKSDDRLLYKLNTPKNNSKSLFGYTLIKWILYIALGVVFFIILSSIVIKIICKDEKENNTDKKVEDDNIEIVSKKIRFKDFLKKVRVTNIIWIFLISAVIASCFFTYINEFVNGLIKHNDVIITVVEPGEVWINSINGVEVTKEIYDSLEKKGKWEFRDKLIFGYNFNSIISRGNNVGESITIDSDLLNSGDLLFYQNSAGGKIDVSCKGEVKTVDLYSDAYGGNYITYSAKVEHSFQFIIMVLIYVALSALICLIILSLLRLIDLYGYKIYPKVSFKYSRMFLIIFIYVYALFIIKYKVIGIPNFLMFGDQSDYWLRGALFCNLFEGGLTIDELELFCNDFPCFRGYMCYFFPAISIFIGNAFSVDPVFIYFIFNSLISAFLFGYVMPGYYEMFNGKKPKYANCILLVIIFTIFWKGFFYNVILDLHGAIYFISSIFMLLKFLKEKKYKYVVFSSILLSAALSVRTSYVVGAVAIIILLIVGIILSKIGIGITRIKGINLGFNKKNVYGIFIAVICFLSVCIPQIYINSTQDYFGLFAYDKVGAWVEEDLTLLEDSINRSIGTTVTGYPYPINDEQIASIRSIAGFTLEDTLGMDESFYAYASSPLDSVIAIVKRMFITFDLKINEIYPELGYSKSTNFYLFSTLNYIVIGTGLYTLLCKKIRKKKIPGIELFVLGVPAIATYAPLLAGAMEWRHGINIYILIYYYLSFYFIDILTDAKNSNRIYKSNYFSFLALFVLGSHLLSLTMYA